MIYPAQIILESCDKCNLACEGCYRHMGGSVHNTIMPWEHWKDIVDSLTWKPAICAFSHGEIFLDPILPKRLQYMAERGHRVDFGTNGTIMREDVLDVVFSYPRLTYQVVVSLDGLYDCTRKYRRHLSDALLPQPVKTVDELIRRKKLLPASEQRFFNVLVSYVDAGQDYAETQSFVKFWLRKGVDIVLVRKYLSSEPTAFHYPMTHCEYLNGHIATVSANGWVRLCDRNMRTAWIKDTREASVLDIYNSPEFAHYREDFPSGPCATCSQAYSGSGFVGQVHFQDDGFSCLYRKDYYNEMFFNLENFNTQGERIR